MKDTIEPQAKEDIADEIKKLIKLNDSLYKIIMKKAKEDAKSNSDWRK